MAVIRVNFLPEFYLGDDAVLLTLDGSGVELVATAVSEARNNGSSRLIHDGVIQEFVIESGSAAVELSPTRVVWRLDDAKAAEIVADLEALSGVGHFYVDMTSPAETLVISRDEYTHIVYASISPE